jgi:hypothetical protein
MKNLYIEMWFENQSIQAQYGRDLIFISKIYSHYISNIKIKNLRKISMEIVEFPDKTRIIPTHKLTKVCLIHKYLNLNVLIGMEEGTQTYNTFLDFLLQNMIELSEIFKWPHENFKEAYNMVIKSNYNYEFVQLSPKLSSDKRYSASVIVKCIKDYNSIILELDDRTHSENKRRIELTKIIYYMDDFSNILHKLKWINNEELLVSNKEEEINFLYSLKNDAFELFLTPRIHNEKYLKDELVLLNPVSKMEECLKINNRRIANSSTM